MDSFFLLKSQAEQIIVVKVTGLNYLIWAL